MIRKKASNMLYKINTLMLLICIFMFFINRIVLNLFNLDYRIWIQRFYIIAMIVLLFTFIIQSIIYLIKKVIKIIKTKKITKAILYISLIIIIIVTTIYIYPIIGIAAIFQFVANEEIIVRDNKKMILETFAWGETHHNFYEYKNVFIKSKEPVFSEVF